MLIPQHAWDRQLESVELQRRHGVPVEVLTVEQAQAITPFDGAGIGGATWGSADGQIDPCAATGAYLTLSHGRGAKTLYNFRVDAIEAGSGGDWVVKAGDRSVRAEHVVNAGGGWAGEVAKLADSMSPSSIHAAMSIPRWRERWMAGTFDAVTPPSQADEAAKTLPHGKVVRFPGIGHDVFIASDCGRQIVADFLSRPDSYDTHCADPMQPPTFVS